MSSALTFFLASALSRCVTLSSREHYLSAVDVKSGQNPKCQPVGGNPAYPSNRRHQSGRSDPKKCQHRKCRETGLTQRKPGSTERRSIGFNLRCIAATELGIEPCCDREVRTGHQQLLGRSPGLLKLASLLTSDHDIRQAKSGVSRMIGLEGGDRLLGSP